MTQTEGFRIQAPYSLSPAQARAVDQLTSGLQNDQKHQVLLGVTGSGKTFTVANVIANLQRPTLVISHNKTLAAQLYTEFREFFPDSAVEFFVSYYDYYQPEAYIPSSDTYIEKDASINNKIERLRLAATSSLMSRRDVIVVASVSCIYGIGSPDTYSNLSVHLHKGKEMGRDLLLQKLVAIYYQRNDIDFTNGRFRVRGDIIEVFPGYDEFPIRIELFGDTIEKISIIEPVTGDIIKEKHDLFIFPAAHFVAEEEDIKQALHSIRHELQEQLKFLNSKNLLLEAQRLNSRTCYDLEMMKEVGYCPGIENYSRHIDRRLPGEAPYALLDYFPEDFLLLVDESHASLPQIRGMYAGDRSRKETLVQHGFRLPSALDNRPLRFEEFKTHIHQAIYISATPAAYELELSAPPVELVVRPTGLIDPVIDIRPTTGQIQDLLNEIHNRVAREERVLVTTLTKKMAEDLSAYIREAGIKGEYLHSEVDTIERMGILRSLREGTFDVVVGVNLLREGLDLPEVSLVAIMDADKEGFLRSETSLIQTIGRTARNVNAAVILYADRITGSMQRAMDETERRRAIQTAYNTEHNIIPATIRKGFMQTLEEILAADELVSSIVAESQAEYDLGESVKRLEEEMLKAATELRFEEAAILRDRIEELQGASEEPSKRKKRKKRFKKKKR
ncbi:excinuclease ABC subunit UvrB [Planctomycetota bacterium]